MAREELAAERARLLLGCYRRADAMDPDTYVLAIATVLAVYDEWVILEATHPRTGIQASEKFKSWPPNSGELKQFCDDMSKRAARYAIYDKLPKPNRAPRLPPPARTEANDRPRPTLDEIKAKYPWLFREKQPPPTRQNALQRLGEITGRVISQAELDAIPDAKKAG